MTPDTAKAVEKSSAAREIAFIVPITPDFWTPNFIKFKARARDYNALAHRRSFDLNVRGG
jgi:hypothetical protein